VGEQLEILTRSCEEGRWLDRELRFRIKKTISEGGENLEFHLKEQGAWHRMGYEASLKNGIKEEGGADSLGLADCPKAGDIN